MVLMIFKLVLSIVVELAAEGAALLDSQQALTEDCAAKIRNREKQTEERIWRESKDQNTLSAEGI